MCIPPSCQPLSESLPCWGLYFTHAFLPKSDISLPSIHSRSTHHLLTIYLSTHQFICPPSTSPSIHPSIVRSLSIHPSIYHLSTHPYIHHSYTLHSSTTYLPLHLLSKIHHSSISPLIHSPIHLSSIFSSIYSPSTYPSIHLPVYLSIHLLYSRPATGTSGLMMLSV